MRYQAGARMTVAHEFIAIRVAGSTFRSPDKREARIRGIVAVDPGPDYAPLTGTANSRRRKPYVSNFLRVLRVEPSCSSCPAFGFAFSSRSPIRNPIPRNACSPQPLAIVGAVEIERRAHGHHAARIDRAVAAVVMQLDRLELDGLRHPGMLVELAHVIGQVGIVVDTADVAFEMSDVDRVEADQCCEKPPVGLGQP